VQPVIEPVINELIATGLSTEEGPTCSLSSPTDIHC
jgi:hypothetical protein